MKLIKFGFYLVLTLILLSANVNVRAEGVDGKKGKVLNKTTGSPAATKFNINNISTFFYNNGDSDVSNKGASGFQFPIGSGKTVFYESGFLYGGYVNNEWRVCGSTYAPSGMLPGRMISATKGEDPAGAAVRIYRVRRDYKDPNADYSKEIMDESPSTKDQIYQQYEKDWNEWPAQYGAPFEDKNGNGTYEPNIDIPGVPGADQTIWYVCNDADATQAQKMYGSVGLGIEMQLTVWGYNQQNALGDALFRKYTLVNKGGNRIDSCYVNMWSDPDLGGDAGDDFAGCDTTLSLGFIYNGDDQDPSYGSYIPSAGFDFLQGPMIPGNSTDRAIFKGKYRYGFKNMPMTAFYLFTQSVPNYGDPAIGNYQTGALAVRNLMQGKVGSLGTKFVDPLTGKTTPFFCPGDPVTGKGWVDGILFPKQDRRMGSVSGPFTLAAGDTQEVVVGQLAAGGVAPIGRLGAVALLKFQDRQVQKAYDNLFVVPQAPKPPLVPVDPVSKVGKASEFDKEIVISWGDDAASVAQVESYNQLGYKFEGYVVYQLPRLNAQLNEAKIVATYDLSTDPGLVLSSSFDAATNQETKTISKYGTNSGLQRSIDIKTDLIRGGVPLANGTEYYFVVSSYAVNVDPETVPNVLESLSSRILAVPHSPNPGVIISGVPEASLPVLHATGLADASVNVRVVDPLKVTGDKYEVSFKQAYYYLASDGTWKTTNFPDHIGKGTDVSPSSLAATGVYSINGTVDVNFVTNIQSAVYSYADGIRLTFPAGIKINSAPSFTAGNGSVTPVINGNVVDLGNVHGEMTENGPFAGGETFKVNISNFSLPFTVNYTIFDDAYGNTGTQINATGKVTISSVGNKFVTQNVWNVKDVTTGVTKLANQTVIANTDLYYTTDPTSGPGGSLGALGAGNVGPNSQPIFDGIQVSVPVGSYVAPIVWKSATLTTTKGTPFNSTSGGAGAGIRIVNYTYFGGVVTSKAIDNYGFGTTDMDQLQQDYELRFTGVMDSTVLPSGQKLIYTKSGGQMATVFALSSGTAFNARPDFPTGQANGPYMVRIPFEVWNVSDPAHPRQVNLMFRDREQAATANPFRSWNYNARVYAIVVNSNYNATQIITNKTTDANNALATWVWVFYSTHYAVGDKLNFVYANPIQLGKDTFTFTTPAAVTVDQNVAKSDVDKINVFPNPYYATNPREVNKYQRFVTFSHLPQRATLRVFNLAGQLVRIIQKDSPSQFTTWDLVNDSSFPVASGLYIVHIDMPDLGTTKIVKLAVIQEQQILDHF